MKFVLSFVVLLVSSLLSQAQIDFDTYFYPKTLRFDFIQGGNADTTIIYPEKFKEEPHWGGPHKNLITKSTAGIYKIELYDAKTNQLIYSRHFNNLFLEWQTTAEAKKMNRSSYESFIMPYPKKKARLELHIRKDKNRFVSHFSTIIDPKDYFIETAKLPGYNTEKVVDNGKPQNKVDVVFIPEGYTKAEMKKFEKDTERFTGYLLNCAPFDKHKTDFNIWRVDAPSVETGTDIPGENIWRNTVLNSTFYTFDIERYLTTSDIKSIRDVAACVPYDQIFVIVNSEKYGGGGIYNHYSMSTADHLKSDFVMVHEFGHGFCGLADEYYTSDVAYEDFYDLSIEPIEANITTLVDFENKWKNMVNKSTPVPTPSLAKYKNTVGAFEGGGYIAKGVFRPSTDCTMKSGNYNDFCPVCQQVLIDMILFICDK